MAMMETEHHDCRKGETGVKSCRLSKLLAFIAAGVFAAISIAGCEPKEPEGQQPEATQPAATEDSGPATEPGMAGQDPGPGEMGWEALYAPTIRMYWDAYVEYLPWEESRDRYRDHRDSLGNQGSQLTLLNSVSSNSPRPKDYFRYCLYDVDQNSVPELFVQASGSLAKFGADIYTIDSSGEAIPLFFAHGEEYNSRLIYSMLSLGKDNSIIVSGGDEGRLDIIVYKVQDGTTIQEIDCLGSQLCIYSPKEWKAAFPTLSHGEDAFWRGAGPFEECRISEDEFDALLEKYLSDEGFGNTYDLEWNLVSDPQGLFFAIGDNVSGGMFVHSYPRIDGTADKMNDGNKIGYIPADGKPVILAGSGRTVLDEEVSRLWFEVVMPQSYRDTPEQQKYYKDQPLAGWVRDDVVQLVAHPE